MSETLHKECMEHTEAVAPARSHTEGQEVPTESRIEERDMLP